MASTSPAWKRRTTSLRVASRTATSPRPFTMRPRAALPPERSRKGVPPTRRPRGAAPSPSTESKMGAQGPRRWPRIPKRSRRCEGASSSDPTRSRALVEPPVGDSSSSSPMSPTARHVNHGQVPTAVLTSYEQRARDVIRHRTVVSTYLRAVVALETLRGQSPMRVDYLPVASAFDVDNTYVVHAGDSATRRGDTSTNSEGC